MMYFTQNIGIAVQYKEVADDTIYENGYKESIRDIDIGMSIIGRVLAGGVGATTEKGEIY